MINQEYRTPNGPMKIDPNGYISFLDLNGVSWSYPANQIQIVKEEIPSGNETVSHLACRLMDINEDYISNLKNQIEKGANQCEHQ